MVAGDVDVFGVGFPQRTGNLGPQDRQDLPGLVASEELGCRDKRLGVLDLGVGTRRTRIAAAAVRTRARTATGWRTLYLKFVVLGSQLRGRWR